MLIHASQAGHARVFEGAAHVVINIRANGTFDYHIYIGDELRCSGAKLCPEANALDAVAAAVRAHIGSAIDDEKVRTTLAQHEAMAAGAHQEFKQIRKARR